MSFQPLQIPVLNTERLILRGWSEKDVEPVSELLLDEEATRFIGGVTNQWQPFRSVCGFIGHWQLRGFGFFAVEERASGECLGWCGLWKPDGWPGNEVGYSLRRKFWGKGFATEAARASLKYAYENLGWTSAISCIDAENFGSQGVAKNLGAKREAEDVEITNFRADIWRHLSPAKYLERFA